METAKPVKTRPYWHVDAKWICGILSLWGVFAVLLLFCAKTITQRDVAVPLATEVVAGMFSRNGLDDVSDINEFKQKAAATPGDTVEPLPGVKISKSDLNTLPPRELRLKIFEQVVAPYYELGAEGVAKQQSSDPATQEKIKSQGFVLGIVNKSSHQQASNALALALLLALIPLAGLVLFSHRFGRLVSPGLVLLAVALPGAIFLTVVSSAAGQGGGPVENIDPAIIRKLASTLAQPFQWTAVFGFGLLISAVIGKIVFRISHRQH